MALASVIPIRLRLRDTQRSVTQFRTLDGVRIGLRVQYAAYDQRWRLWLFAPDGAQIAGPETAVPGIELFRAHKYDARVPPGQLFVYSPTREPPTLETVDLSAKLYYRPASEVVS